MLVVDKAHNSSQMHKDWSLLTGIQKGIAERIWGVQELFSLRSLSTLGTATPRTRILPCT